MCLKVHGIIAFVYTLRVWKKPVATLNGFHNLLVAETVLDDLLVLNHSLNTLSDLPDCPDAVAKRLSDARGPILDLQYERKDAYVVTTFR